MFQYNFDNCVPVVPDLIKNLGVNYDPKLTFIALIDKITASTYRFLEFVIETI